MGAPDKSLASGLQRERYVSRRRQPRRCRIEVLEPRLAMAAIQEWQPRGAGGGGALFSPSINPANPDEIYVASDMGQVFHTTDEGAVWQTVDHRELHGSHNAKVQFTVDPSVRYALDYPHGGDFTLPTKSVDGGRTWTPLAADPTGGEAISLIADYRNPNRLLVSDYRRMWLSTDGGISFQLRYATSSGDGLHLGGAFFDGDFIFVGTNQGVLTTSDGGNSFQTAAWSGIPADQRIVSFAGARENGARRFWAVTAAAGDVYGGVQGWEHGGFRGIYTLDSGQTAWRPSMAGLASGATPFFVAATLDDIDTVYVAGGSSASRPTVHRSTTGGDSWQSVLLTVGNANVATAWSGDGGARGWSYGENALGFAISALDASRLVFTDYGFAYASDDGGASWQTLTVTPADRNPPGTSISLAATYRTSGLDNTSSWDLAWATPQRLVGAASDIRGVISSDGGESWSFNYSGHTQNSMYRVVVHPGGTLYAATATVHDLYQSTHLTDSRIDGGSGRVLFSADQGTRWQTLHDFGHVVSWVELDPQHPQRLYAAVAHSTEGGIYVSDDIHLGAASTWRRLASPPRTEGHPANVRVLRDGTLVASYSGRRAGSPLAFTPSSGVFVSTDGGQTWLDRSHAGMRYWTKDVVVDPHDARQNTWYASVFSGWGGAPNGLGGVYRTTDRGLSWTRINALDRVNSITISPVNPDEAYVTTEVEGLWYTDQIRLPAPTFTPVEGFKFQQPLRVLYNPHDSSQVWVTTFGGGLWTGTTTPPQASPGVLRFESAHYAADETGGTLQLSVTRTGGSAGTVSVRYDSQDGTATGGVDFAPASGTLTWADGDATPRTLLLSVIDDALVESDETMNLLLSDPTGGAALGTPSTATVTIRSNDVPAVIAFSASGYQASEGAGQAVVTVSRTGNTASAARVTYRASSGTAADGYDFTAVSGSIEFAPGQTQQSFAIPILEDALDEIAESIQLALSDPSSGSVVGTPGTAVLQILDNDEPPPPPPSASTIRLDRADYDTREDYGYRSIYIERSGDLSQPATVQFTTRDGTARAGSDYVARSGTVRFEPGVRMRRVDVTLVNDKVLEATESFLVELRNASGASLGQRSSATITVRDDEINAPGVLQFSKAVFQTRENWGYVRIYVTRSAGLVGQVSVAYSTGGGSAVPNSHYRPVSGTLTFADGESTRYFDVPLIDDRLRQGARTLEVFLSQPGGGASLGSQTSALIQIADDES